MVSYEEHPAYRERPALPSTLFVNAVAATTEHVAPGRDDHIILTFQKAYKATPQLILYVDIKCAPGIATCAISVWVDPSRRVDAKSGLSSEVYSVGERCPC